MPEVDEDYNPVELTQFKLETRYNNQRLSANDLIEVVSLEPNKAVVSGVSSSNEKTQILHPDRDNAIFVFSNTKTVT